MIKADYTLQKPAHSFFVLTFLKAGVEWVAKDQRVGGSMLKKKEKGLWTEKIIKAMATAIAKADYSPAPKRWGRKAIRTEIHSGELTTARLFAICGNNTEAIIWDIICILDVPIEEEWDDMLNPSPDRPLNKVARKMAKFLV